ncbi:MAG: glycosyltransferase family 2 protein [Candidatus Omnitrophica bacterium]|nr:glycosyltransferase family 2 protein [Candidatus Omnitrophota bacterium]MDD5236612.1 glycosyltransferase family 2 protein [Candidatus Omnitrophota bacterium]MDD5610183.1 glycosyltransferase family 2 protein [Candidatus Omnitrophota bacterium]
MKLSVVVPAHNEEECVGRVLEEIITGLDKARIEHEIIAVNDSSTDSTPKILSSLAAKYPQVKVVNRQLPNGFGRAIKSGLERVTGEAVAIVMADASDDPEDIVRYFRKIEEGYDCVFGSRFIKGAHIYDYPKFKLFLNRLANTFIKLLFLRKENDITNAFKMYKTGVIKACSPLLASHFNITVEIPLKAITRGFKVTQVPISWYGRKSGVSKLKIKEITRKYLFTVFYVWLEKILLSDELKN